MKNTRSTIALIALSSFYMTLSHSAFAQQDNKNDLKIEAKQTTSIGSAKMYNGDVRITTGSVNVSLQAQSGNIIIKKITNKQSETIGITPFDTSSQTISFNNGVITMEDKQGHSITVTTNAPASANTSTGQPTSEEQEQQPQPKKKKRYVDPVTDRGHVIP